MDYLSDLELTSSDINILNNTLGGEVLEKVKLFPEIVKKNYQHLKNVGVSNYKKIFMEYTHMFLINPDRLFNTFEKYDRADLIRCLEKNGAVIEKL